MEKIVSFIDINDKERRAKSFYVVTHEGEEFVEVEIVGNKGEWLEWYQLDRFQERNPRIVLMRKPEEEE